MGDGALREWTGTLDTVRRVTHGLRLLGHLTGYVVLNRQWLLMPLMMALLAVGLAVTVTEVVVPYTLYPLF